MMILVKAQSLRLKFQAPKQAFYPTLTFIALVQPSLQTTQENSKDSLFGAMIPPTGTIPGSFIPSTMPGAGVFNPVGVQHQQSSTDKTPQCAETMEAELTLQGKWVYKHILHNVNTSHMQLLAHGMLLFYSIEQKKRILLNLAAVQ